MQKLLICALAAGTLLMAAPAVADEGPWCLRYSLGPVVPEVCHFRTFEACRDERGFFGSTASCTQNPRHTPDGNIDHLPQANHAGIIRAPGPIP